MKHILTLAALVFATSCFGQEVCPNMYDGNGNGTIDIEDFLGILGLFGDVDVDSDGLWDSQDGCASLEACNYHASSAQFCFFPDASGHCCGNPISYQGYEYETVQIGEQCWFAENLKNESYRNGDPIDRDLSVESWLLTQEGASAILGEGGIYCYSYSDDFDQCDPELSLEFSGRLYNWIAVNDPRQLCPNGTHVPSNDEWNVLIELLSELGDDWGDALKASAGWSGGGNGTNSSGFAAVPGGYRSSGSGAFGDGDWARFWTSSEPDEYGGTSHVGIGQSQSGSSITVGSTSSSFNTRAGLSIRCIKDSE